MADGYGFGGEGDWKTCALLRAMKVMAPDSRAAHRSWRITPIIWHPNGHLVLGSHMLEICESIAAGKPSLEIHPLGIGGKGRPGAAGVRRPPGPAINASLIDLGNRFRLIVNEVDVVAPPQPLPKLPVARAVWKCRPDFKTACAAWIYAGGAITRVSAMRHNGASGGFRRDRRHRNSRHRRRDETAPIQTAAS